MPEPAAASPAPLASGASPCTPLPAADARPRPQSLTDLFLTFTWMALQGFGGVLAVVQRELVEKKQWMTLDEFVEEWSAAQVLPGPNVVNMAMMMGDRHFGARGALVAVAGMLAVPTLLIIVLAILYASFGTHPHVAGALRGMGAVAAGLIAATGMKMIAPLRRHPLGFMPAMLAVVVVFCAVALLRIPLGWVLLVVGGTACVLTYRRLAP